MRHCYRIYGLMLHCHFGRGNMDTKHMKLNCGPEAQYCCWSTLLVPDPHSLVAGYPAVA